MNDNEGPEQLDAAQELSPEAMLASLSSNSPRTVTVGGKYVLQRELGRGAMGRVYVARQLRLDRIVAVKVLTESTVEDFHRRFLLEATVLAAVNHRNIVTIFDSGESGRMLYLVMEYLQGSTLAQALLAERSFTVARSVELATQVARGLRAAHKKGIVHRDLKPSNLFLTTDEEGEVVKVFDFGVAKNTQPIAGPVSDATRDGLIVGTPSFMAPEQIEGGVVDGRTDLYALGCLMYLMLSGTPPFTAPSELEVLLAHLKQQPVPLRLLPGCEAVPVAVEDVVMRLLQKQQDARYADADAVVTALQAAAATLAPEQSALRLERAWSAAVPAPGVLAEDAPTVSRTMPPAPASPPPATRQHASAVAIGVAVVVTLLVGLGIWALKDPPQVATAAPTTPAVTPTTPAVTPPPAAVPPVVATTPLPPIVATTASTPTAVKAKPRAAVKPTPVIAEPTPPRVRPRIGIVDDEPGSPSPTP